MRIGARWGIWFSGDLCVLLHALTQIQKIMQVRYSQSEEFWNAGTHIFGTICGLIVSVWLLHLAAAWHSLWAYIGVTLYALGMLASYATSSLYHALDAHHPGKQRLRKWDHAAIYWHIAGSYSPLMLTAMRQEGAWGWSLFAFVWASAALGTVLSFTRLKERNYLETFCYVMMGLSILVAFKPLSNTVSSETIAWIIGEGVCYIFGAVLYAFFKRPYMHTVFHFCVLGGSACHIMAVVNVLTHS